MVGLSDMASDADGVAPPRGTFPFQLIFKAFVSFKCERFQELATSQVCDFKIHEAVNLQEGAISRMSELKLCEFKFHKAVIL